MVSSIGEILNYWESLGVFSIILPFLLVFAIFYGILSNIKLFEDNRGINVMISFAAALTATAMGYYGNCLKAVMLAFAITLIVILVYFLFVSFIIKDQKIVNYLAAIIAVIIFILVFIRSEECDLAFLGNLGNYVYLIPIAVAIALIIWVILGRHTGPDKPGKFDFGEGGPGGLGEGPGGPGGRGPGAPRRGRPSKAKKGKGKKDKGKKPDDRDVYGPPSPDRDIYGPDRDIYGDRDLYGDRDIYGDGDVYGDRDIYGDGDVY